MYITDASKLVGVNSIWLSFQLTYWILRFFFFLYIIPYPRKLTSVTKTDFWVLIKVSRGHIWGQRAFFTGIRYNFADCDYSNHDPWWIVWAMTRDGDLLKKRTNGFWPCESNLSSRLSQGSPATKPVLRSLSSLPGSLPFVSLVPSSWSSHVLGPVKSPDQNSRYQSRTEHLLWSVHSSRYCVHTDSFTLHNNPMR